MKTLKETRRRHCRDCDKGIRKQNKSGLCVFHFQKEYRKQHKKEYKADQKKYMRKYRGKKNDN